MKRSDLYKIIAFFQYRENYAAFDWDGTGECPQHWKNKGSIEIEMATGLTEEIANSPEFLEFISDRAIDMHDKQNEWTEQNFIGCEVQKIDKLTWLEEQEAQYEGGFRYLACHQDVGYNEWYQENIHTW